MTIAIDFNKPATTDAYTGAGGFVPNLQANMQALSTLLDTAYTTIANQAAGTKRFNSTSGLFEQWSGTAWAALPVGYAKTGGDTFTGAMTFNNNVGVQWKSSGGTAYRVGLVSAANNIYFGDIDAALTGASLLLVSNGTGSVQINVGATNIVNVASGFVSYAKQITVAAGAGQEQIRLNNDNGYLSFWNSASATRSGYIQGNAASGNFTIMSEAAGTLTLGTSGANAVLIDTSQRVGINMTPNAVAKLSVNGGMYVQGAATVPATIGAGLFSFENPVFREYIGDGTGYSRAFSKRVGGVTTDLVTISDSGNLLVGLASPIWASAGRGDIEVNGASNAIFGMSVAGSQAGYMYHDGTNMHVQNSRAGALTFDTNGTTRITVASNGASTFTGGALTTTNVVGNTGGAVSIDSTKSNVHTITLTSNMTSLALNMSDGQTVNVFITQDGTGSRTWAGVGSANSFVWPGGTVPALSTAAGSVDLMVVTYRAATGKFYCSLAKAFA